MLPTVSTLKQYIPMNIIPGTSGSLSFFCHSARIPGINPQTLYSIPHNSVWIGVALPGALEIF